MTTSILRADDYTVGWICALPIEMAAAKAILDDHHDGLPLRSHDRNIYALGRIGSHNVVLACLPAGVTGTTSAAVVANQMRSDFTSIRFGLMVGVGGGVPSTKTDIRLGDVVISKPEGRSGGVIQYDFGKRVKDSRFVINGSLNKPPSLLLSAVSNLHMNHFLGETKLLVYLSDIASRYPQLGSCPGIQHDKLFDAEYDHEEDGDDLCTRCDSSRLISRPGRDGDDPRIHYGAIASGNQVMRDGITRDRLSAELGGVLCFEMEAAGLMNDFPCLVIRGICDYADSHKNKVWQPYAAATAAACAKEILSLIPAAEVVKTEVVGELRKYHIPFSLKGVPAGKFADRPQDTEALERALISRKGDRRRRILVVHGLGGVGKTQLAAGFARRHQHSFTSVFWLDGSSGGSLKQSIAACASRIPAGQVAKTNRMYTSGQGGDLDAVVKDVLRWLSIPDNRDWLVVVDNVDRDYRPRGEDPDAYDVDDYLPKVDHGSVLITTRLTHLGQLGERWEVKKVDKDRARAIFETWYEREAGRGESDELLGLLDGLPLALAQAAAYMSETGTSFSTYTRLYKEQWRDLMEPQDGRHMPLRSYSNGSVATTWMISYTAIRTRSEAAANLLLLWAHLDNKSLWHGLLAAASRRLTITARRTLAWLQEIACNEMEFIKAIGMLRSYSLVEEMHDQTGYATHPVVHQWALHIQDDGQRAELSWVAIAVVGLAVPDKDERKYWETQVRLLPHAERCEKRIEEAIKDKFEEGRSNEQMKEYEVLLWAVHGLGHLYKDRGKLEDAEKMYVRVLEGCEKALGAEHTSTLNTVNSLGNLYKHRGKLDEAEKMYVRALEGYEKALGAEHTSTLSTVNNLGNLYKHRGKLDEAEKMFVRALEGREKALGAEHTDALDTVNNLGNLYADRGKLDEAEKMFVRALEGREKALRAEHTSTLNTVNNLGLLYADRGKLDEAEKMYVWALEGREKALGAEHTSTLSTVNNLGSLYKLRGKLDEAEKMYVRALEGYEKALGAEHTWTLDTVHNLGLLYVDRGKLDEAEKMFVRALEGYERALGPEHIATFIPALNTMWGLAFVFNCQDRVEDARTFYSKALSGYRQVAGDDHPKCQTLRDSLAAFGKEGDKTSAATKRGSVQAHSQPQTIVDSVARRKPSTSRGPKILTRLGLKRT
ncbi:hypothetical protein K469DRAFT_574669 [Zopfia rhizophila CBS 207.26]|uniref:Nucleoside phosphorylase domain-containing protein n=1 Tax=Zopfia rhizophila CBS 207.26 TaxID=1314779 RepID=A0A6A6E216_9PEZI|nr:hypothetical protein K469DRAFT_574669 [Zopfia rhizophila CBS 207.26]